MNSGHLRCVASLTTRLGVSEEELQSHGLGTPDVWEEQCFSATNNRLVLFDGEVCGAVVTHLDHNQAGIAEERRQRAERDGVLETVVAIEVLPRFRRRGIACDVIRSFARDGAVAVLSPCETLRNSLARVATVEDRDSDTLVTFAPSPSLSA
jgi:ribosomal protein S18 acetylase RimI-like enzyme